VLMLQLQRQKGSVADISTRNKVTVHGRTQ